MDDSSDDYEEQEFLVYVQLDSQSITDEHLRNASKIQLHGIDTRNPLLQVNNLFFQGNFDTSMGTHIFFEKDDETPVDDLYAKCESYYEFVAKTNKVLRMSRILLKNKQDGEDDERETEPIDDQDDLVKSESYQAALDQLLRPSRDPPRKILNSNQMIQEVQENTETMEIDISNEDNQQIIDTTLV